MADDANQITLAGPGFHGIALHPHEMLRGLNRGVMSGNRCSVPPDWLDKALAAKDDPDELARLCEGLRVMTLPDPDAFPIGRREDPIRWPRMPGQGGRTA